MKKDYRNKNFNEKKDCKGSKKQNSGKDVIDKKEFSRYNDYSWYSKFPLLIKDAARLSFNNPMGLKVLNMDTNIKDRVLDTNFGSFQVPGIMRLGITPTIGVSDTGNSDVNVTMRLVYSWVRHANSGAKVYEATDYMTYLLAMDSIYAFHSEMCRLYGILLTYSNVNRYIAKGLITALGYDYDNIIAHISDLRAYINTYAVKANTFAVPNSMAYYDRHYMLPSKVFKDSEEDKCGLYVFQNDAFYAWNATQYETGSALIFTPYKNISTFEQIVEFGDNLINNLLTNEDIGIMSGDTLKAYGEGQIFHLQGITDQYTVVPVYDKGILMQIHNAKVLDYEVFIGDDGDIKNNFNIVQEGLNLVWNPSIDLINGGVLEQVDANRLAFALAATDPILDIGQSDPSEEAIVESSRLVFKLKIDSPAAGETILRFGAVGSEFCSSLKIYMLDNDGSVKVFDPTNSYMFSGIFLDKLSLFDFVNIIYKNYFDWAPSTPLYGDFLDDDTVRCLVSGEVFNYTPVPESVLVKLHRACLLSLFNVKGIGVYI